MSDYKSRPYRPSNGTEGEGFMARFCERCVRDRAARQGNPADGCEIIVATMCLQVDDPDYPTEWIVDDMGPRCTAFKLDEGDDDGDKRPAPPEPDPRQLVLIADPTEVIANVTPAATIPQRAVEVTA